MASRKTPLRANNQKVPTNLRPQHRSFHSVANIARRGGPRQRVVGVAGAMAMSAFFFAACIFQVQANNIGGVSKTMITRLGFTKPLVIDRKHSLLSSSAFLVRGGGLEQLGEPFDVTPTPPVEFAHGTTTLSFVFQGGIVAAVDSRASIGNFVGSKTTQKVLPVSK